MPRYRNDYDEADDDDDRDPEEPDDFDRDDDDDLFGTDTDPCPSCQREVHYQTDICPHCGHFIARNDPPYSHRAVWIIAALALLLTAALMILATGAPW
jgi:hypothetical protein